jgi:leucyl aminopeptidase
MADIEGTIKAREMLNTRGTPCTPDYFAEHIREAAKGYKNVTLKELNADQLLENGMNMFHAVGRSATSKPQLLYVEYRGDPSKTDFEYVLLGKGLTYDTGGLNLKPTGFIEDMYMDKGGACAVYGAMISAIKSNLGRNVIFAMALAENAIDAESYKPHDILTSMKGLTVEVGNTDAEGRLVLADAMTYL